MNLKKLLNKEGGVALILALIILAIGSLLLVPLLTYIGSSYKATDRVYDQKANQLYAADAGIRDAILQIQQSPWDLPSTGNTTSPYYVAGENAQVGTLNGKNVSYTITGIDPTMYHSAAAYRITSTASDPSDSGNKTVIQADVNFIDFFTTYTQNAITASDTGTVTSSGGGNSNPVVYGNIQSSSTDSINIYSQIYSSWLSTSAAKGSTTIDAENNVINNVFIMDGGSGYTSTPSVYISENGTDPLGASGAAATATVTGGVITSINITNNGYGYIAPVVSITGGGGTNAFAVANVNNGGNISSITVLNGGTNYTDSTPPVVTVSENGNESAQATATVINGTITSIDVTYPGVGYSAPMINITGGGGSGAIAVATVADLNNFPVPGTILVGSGNKAETLDYSSINPIDNYSSQINLTTPTQNDHSAGEPVVLINPANGNTVLGWPWSPTDPANNPVQSFYYKQAQLSDVTQVSGGTIDLSASTIQGKSYDGGPLYVNGNAVLTTSNKTVTLNGNYSNRVIYVNGTISFDNKAQLLLNGYTVFSSSTASKYAITFGTQSILGGPGAIIANGGIYFSPKLTNNGEYLYVMSIMGTVDFQPQGDFSGSVAGYDGVNMQPGTSITWSPAPSGLNLPGQDQTLVLGNIKLWKIN